jgi:hypothetical protein
VTFRELLGTIRARWYVTALVALLTLGAAWKVDHPPRYYQADTVLLLIPPKDPSAPNALAAATPSIAQTGVLVDTILSDAASADRIRKAGVVGHYSVAPRNNGTVQTPRYTIPAEQLIVSGGDPDVALGSVITLSTAYAKELDDLQARAGVTSADRITTQVLVPPAVAPVRGSKTRGLIGVAAIGGIATVLLPTAFDRYARRRSRRLTAKRRHSPGKSGTAGAESPKERLA